MTATVPEAGYVVAQRRHVGRYVAVAACLLLVALVVRAFAVGKIDWRLVGSFLQDTDFLSGMANSVMLTVCAMALGIALGLAAALMVSSANPVLRGISLAYTFLFRAVPVLLQLLIWYNLALVFPTVTVPGVWSAPTTDVITPFIAALLAFGISQGAYTSEVIRGGLLSVGKGQTEAARSIGMTGAQALRRIVIPQAMRVIVPPLGNEFIGMVKYTSLASIIQYREVIYTAQSIYYANGRVVELLVVSAVWYAGVVALLTALQRLVERRFNRSTRLPAARAAAA